MRAPDRRGILKAIATIGVSCVIFFKRAFEICSESLYCYYVNLVTRTNVPGEEEYLFAPYSVFTVVKVHWHAGTDADPHIIELLAAVDNMAEPEDLPLAPWS